MNEETNLQARPKAPYVPGPRMQRDAAQPARLVPQDPHAQMSEERRIAEETLEAERRAQRDFLIELCQAHGQDVAGFERLTIAELRTRALQTSAQSVSKIEKLTSALKKIAKRK